MLRLGWEVGLEALERDEPGGWHELFLPGHQASGSQTQKEDIYRGHLVSAAAEALWGGAGPVLRCDGCSVGLSRPRFCFQL